MMPKNHSSGQPMQPAGARSLFRGNATLEFVVPMAIILAFVAMWSFVFGRGYLQWYLDNGFFIAFVASFVSLIWPHIEEEDRVMSAHPLTFIEGHASILLVMMEAIAADTHPSNRPARRALASSLSGVPRFALALDGLLAIAVMLILIIACLVWLLFIVPLNYFIVLAAGSLARRAARTNNVHRVAIKGRTIIRFTLSDPNHPNEKEQDLLDHEVRLSARPVALTQFLTALVIAMVDTLTEHAEWLRTIHFGIPTYGWIAAFLLGSGGLLLARRYLTKE